MSAANRTRALCVMDLANDFCDDVFCDGLSDYCVRSNIEERFLNMPLENLPTLIKRLRGHIIFDRYRDVLRQSEAATRYTLIDPFLRELGWDTGDPALVRPEYRTGSHGKSVDYALFSNGKPVIMLEAKSLDTPLRCAVKQVIKYCRRTRTKYAAVTDGRRWKIYEAQQTGAIKENRIPSFDPESPSVEFDLKSLSAMDECREVWKSWRPKNISVHGGRICKPLSEIEPNNNDPAPTKIMFPDGSISVPITWESMLFQVARWLISNNILDSSHCPIRVLGNSKRYIVNTKPLHLDNTCFSKFSHEERGLHIEGNFDNPRLAKHTQRIIKEAGEKLENFEVWLP